MGTAERAQLYKWLAWMTNTLQASLILYFYPERWVDEAMRMDESSLRRMERLRSAQARRMGHGAEVTASAA